MKAGPKGTVFLLAFPRICKIHINATATFSLSLLPEEIPPKNIAETIRKADALT